MSSFLTARRNFLRGTGALLGSTAMGIQADEENFRTVSIFHTTDLNGRILPNHTYAGVENIGGLARCATRIRQWRRESPHSLLVDTGDVYHGTFGTGDLPVGDITVGDCWKLLPYETRLVTAEFGARDLIEIIKEERSLKQSDRILWPFHLKLNSEGGILSFKHRDTVVADDARFTIAFNCYDGQSASRALKRLREIVSHPSANRGMIGINTRSALIDASLACGVIG